MKSRYLIAACTVLLAAVGITIAQPETRTRPVAPPDLVPVDRPAPAPTAVGPTLPFPNPPVVNAPAAPTTSAAKEVKPEDLTIDQLLDAVEKFESQKAELEKKQRAFVKVLHLKAALQKQRIDSLPGSQPVAPPYAVSEPPPSSIPTSNSPLDPFSIPAKPQR
ncbi:hypothetical protein J8F10_13420 [Gemmata sp. G18]|uniref:Uncharacterized protein n=1 Tax=Gemmata palustris TaxID=2822762 RepID=A0ABS5BRG1_9BACT|nr:hypothetical protein [Gemmata palustris]MBP3956284.1 hypothetical protein [Gemmata palustris]